MVERLFSIQDGKAESYSPVMQARTSLEALRTFKDIVNGKRGESDVSRHPEDYTLWELGSFNVDTGEIVPQAKKALTNGADLLDRKENLN